MGSKTKVVEIELRNSERQSFTTCPQQWDWGYNDRLKPKTPAPALRFGTLIHNSLEAFYIPGIKRGPIPADTFQKLYDKDLKKYAKMGFKDEDDQWYEAGVLGVAMLEAYFDKYGKDDRWRVLASEIPFRVPVVDEKTGITFTYVGVMDLVMLDRESGKRKDLWVWDHKTTKDDPSKKGDALVLDEQSGSYWSYGVDYLVQEEILRANQRLSGMMFNFLRKGMKDERPQNAAGQYLNKPTKADLLKFAADTGKKPPKDKSFSSMTVDELCKRFGDSALQLGEISKTQPSPLFHREPVYRDEYDKGMARSRIIAQARMMHYMRTGKLEIYKVPGVLHNPHCKWCPYKDPCEIHEMGGDYKAIFKSMYETWEPYAQHEIEDGEKR
jgi:hypothetical protein